MCSQDEMYKTVCKDRFDSLDRKIDKIYDALQGSNGDGMKGRIIRIEEEQKNLRRWRNGMIASMTAAMTALGTWIGTK